MWKSYLHSIGENPENTNKKYSSWYFCDNEKSADKLAVLVLEGTKRATASLYHSYDSKDEVQKVGDLRIITNWNGVAQCIIETTNIDIVSFKDDTEEFAATEAEGDKSLAYWKRVHWSYFSREMNEIGKESSEDMLVVCEKFKVVYK